VRFVVVGAGAVGGVVGVRLLEAGHDVTFVARGAHLDAIRSSGLTIEEPAGSRTVAADAVATPADVQFGADDAVLLCVKSQDTSAVLDALVAAAPPTIAVACLQNGVENERAALRLLERVQATVVMLPAAHLEPGVVQQSSAPVPGILDTGRYPAGVDDVTASLVAAFRDAGFAAEAREDVMRWKRRKLLMNLANAAEALCGRGRGREVHRRAVAEGEACLAAAGLDVVSEAEDLERRGDLIRIQPVGGAVRGGGSSWQSLRRGTGTIEADHLNGEIVLLGREHGVPTPVNALLQRLAREAARERRAPGTMTEDEILAML
jgi:2-dehydropantoate 2-reductase